MQVGPFVTKALAHRVVRLPEAPGCWLWTGCIMKRNGYGVACNKPYSQTITTHRAAWILAFGEVRDGLHVLHKCDVPSCVRPDHLYLGTHQDNMADRCRKNRNRIRQPHYVNVIRALVAQGFERKDLASVYGLSISAVGDIVNGKSWPAPLNP